jgi:hypothetical protein
LEHTISSEEFHHKLKSGQFQEAALMISNDPTLLERGFTQELDVTTHAISDNPTAKCSENNGYIRTKINLLTGEVHNEVSHNLVIDSIAYINLQKLHTQRIEASYCIVRGHLDRIKAILTALLQTIQQPSIAANDKANTPRDSIGMGVLTANPSQSRSHQPHSVPSAIADIDERHDDCPATIGNTSNQIDRLFQSDESLVEGLAADSLSVAPGEFDEIDLSIQTEDEVWEEWVEDDDFQPESLGAQPPTILEELKLPELQEHWVRRPLSPIDVKPIVPRATAISSDPIERWEKFVPEYIEIEDRHRSTKTG